MSMEAYRLLQKIDELIATECWSKFPKLWQELVPEGAIAHIVAFGGRRSPPNPRLIEGINSSLPQFIGIHESDNHYETVSRNIKTRIDDPEYDGSFCIKIELGSTNPVPMEIKISCLDFELRDLDRVFFAATQTCIPEVLKCLYPPAFSLILKSFQDISRDIEYEGAASPFESFVATVLESCNTAYYSVITSPEQKSCESLQQLVRYIPDVGKRPAIVALQAANIDAATLLFSHLGKIHQFEEYDYSPIVMEDRSILDVSKNIPQYFGHKHRNLVAGQCNALEELISPNIGDQRDMVRISKLSILLAEELPNCAFQWVSSNRFLAFMCGPIRAIESILGKYHDRYKSSPIAKEKIEKDPRQFVSDFEVIDHLIPYFLAATDLLCTSGAVDQTNIFLSVIMRVNQLNRDMNHILGKRAEVFEFCKLRLEERLLSLKN